MWIKEISRQFTFRLIYVVTTAAASTVASCHVLTQVPSPELTQFRPWKLQGNLPSAVFSKNVLGLFYCSLSCVYECAPSGGGSDSLGLDSRRSGVATGAGNWTWLCCKSRCS